MGNFPSLKVTGGPAGVNLKAQLDGKTIDGCNRIEIVGDVHDVMRVIVHQIVELDIETQVHPGAIDTIYTGRLYRVELDAEGFARKKEVVVSTGASEREVIEDILASLP